ncbi:response regulator [Paenibacillus methanolicus]|uniref:YesN/AraC family two-component response regulator n=1 Tax=Paenibacillus methanolicus TaxID=582686 RepID=A0A5S5BRG1_9BACL|nr:response regulator [Paenibacillus methanolicus]TYP69795.1 YesN/AraC family two-component response regulator [Paenibacillus methanolicus]
MHNILIVDDEPLICMGISNLLVGAGLGIGQIYMAHNAYEALDYLRMEDIDLLITDIQMGTMSGLELMQQAKLIKPWVQTIVISAHETFQYAQTAMRLGAKDYLIKPLSGAQVMDTVRDVLLQTGKSDRPDAVYSPNVQEDFRMESPLEERMALLRELMAGERFPESREQLALQYGIELRGPYFAVITAELRLSDDLGERDRSLLRYAALNIAGELTGQGCAALGFYMGPASIGLLLQWDEAQYAALGPNKINGIDMTGRSLHFTIKRVLKLDSIVGISQILRGEAFVPELYEQARKAARWHQELPDHEVFYYGDFKWSQSSQEPTEEELAAQNNMTVELAVQYIHKHYSQKGLSLHEVAQGTYVSPNYLSYLFKKSTGTNLWEYVTKLRMEEGRRLLLETRLRRYEIAERVGYDSPEHFGKIFKKYYGISPSELKK